MEHDGLRVREHTVREDFAAALDKIDFSEAYNPNSADFDKALRLGLMWLLLGKLCQDGAGAEVAAQSDEQPCDDIADELSGAKRCLQRYIDTNDAAWKSMASDKLRHAGMLIKKAQARLPGGEEKARLRSHEAEMQEIAAQVDRD